MTRWSFTFHTFQKKLRCALCLSQVSKIRRSERAATVFVDNTEIRTEVASLVRRASVNAKPKTASAALRRLRWRRPTSAARMTLTSNAAAKELQLRGDA